MAQTKLPIKDILAAVDMNAKSVWKEFTDEERKQVSFWLLNRYVSAINGSRDDQELAVLEAVEVAREQQLVLVQELLDCARLRRFDSIFFTKTNVVFS